MNSAIIGGGALGSFLAATLASATHLWLVTSWAEHAAAIRSQGLALFRLDGSEARVAVQVVEDPAELAGCIDLAVIAVKSHSTRSAADKARIMLRADGLALTLQNGLGNLPILAEVLGPARAVQGVTALGATLLGPGRVRHAGLGPTTLALGPALARQPASIERLRACARLFEAAGLETHIADNLDGLLWGKLAVNAGINALTAILRLSNGALAELAPARELMAAAAEEAAAVAQAQGIALPYPSAAARAEQVAVATASNRSSMLQDVLRGAPTEIDVINGAIVREAQRLGLPTPVNQVLAQLVRAIESSYGHRL